MTLDPDEWSGKKFRWLFQGHEELASFSSPSSLSSRNLFHASAAHRGGAARRTPIVEEFLWLFKKFLIRLIQSLFITLKKFHGELSPDIYVHISVTLEGEFEGSELTDDIFLPTSGDSVLFIWLYLVRHNLGIFLENKSVNWKILFMILVSRNGLDLSFQLTSLIKTN